MTPRDYEAEALSETLAESRQRLMSLAVALSTLSTINAGKDITRKDAK